MLIHSRPFLQGDFKKSSPQADLFEKNIYKGDEIENMMKIDNLRPGVLAAPAVAGKQSLLSFVAYNALYKDNREFKANSDQHSKVITINLSKIKDISKHSTPEFLASIIKKFLDAKDISTLIQIL